jgi:hypothetical protein
MIGGLLISFSIFRIQFKILLLFLADMNYFLFDVSKISQYFRLISLLLYLKFNYFKLMFDLIMN